MLSIYRRHKTTCKFAADRVSKKCRCALWADGVIEGKHIRRSLKTRSFERAQQLIREIEDGTKPTEQPKSISIKDALDAFVADCESRKLAPKTLSKYRTLAARFRDFSILHGIPDLRAWSQRHADAFRASWNGSSITLSKTLELARVIARYWHDRGWIEQNWFKAIKPPKVKAAPRLPFDEKEIQAIFGKAKDNRELAFFQILRYTGLRIGDASLLKVSHVSEGRVHLHTTKSGTPISVVIPPALDSLLKALPKKGGYFFLRGESVHVHSASDAWRKRIKKICKHLKITPDHPHRFRHSLAADLLSRGVSVENVAAILGNTPGVVQRHYSQWIRSRQDALDDALKSTWKPALVLVRNS